MGKPVNNKPLDPLNQNILAQLQKDGRLPTVEIGRRIGLSAPAVAERIQKLEDQGYIKGYKTLLDLDKLGLTIRAFISFKAVVAKLDHIEMIRMIDSISEIIEWYTVTGNYSILLKVVTCSSERLAAIIQHLEDYGETNTALILQESRDQKILHFPDI
jgi:Lrp/AsnC family leucine-responsive transcriptional regulator